MKQCFVLLFCAAILSACAGSKKEEEAEDYEHIHRFLTALEHLGVLDRAQGIIFGERVDIPKDCESSTTEVREAGSLNRSRLAFRPGMAMQTIRC